VFSADTAGAAAFVSTCGVLESSVDLAAAERDTLDWDGSGSTSVGLGSAGEASVAGAEAGD